MGLGRILSRIWRFFAPKWTAMTQKQIADIDRAVSDSIAKGTFTPPRQSSQQFHHAADGPPPPLPPVPTADQLWSLDTRSDVESVAQTVHAAVAPASSASSVRRAPTPRGSHYSPPSVYGGHRGGPGSVYSGYSTSSRQPSYYHHPHPNHHYRSPSAASSYHHYPPPPSSYHTATPSATPTPIPSTTIAEQQQQQQQRLWSMSAASTGGGNGNSSRSRAPSLVSSRQGGRESRDSGYESVPMVGGPGMGPRKYSYYSSSQPSSSSCAGSPSPYAYYGGPQQHGYGYYDHQQQQQQRYAGGYYDQQRPYYDQGLRRQRSRASSIGGFGGGDGVGDLQLPAPSYIAGESRYPDARFVRPPAMAGEDGDDGIVAGKPVNAPY